MKYGFKMSTNASKYWPLLPWTQNDIKHKDWTAIMVSRSKIVIGTVFKNGPSSGGGHCRTKGCPMLIIAVGVNLQVFSNSIWCLLTVNCDCRLEIKACFRKTMLYRFYFSQNQGGTIFFYRINFAIVLDQIYTIIQTSQTKNRQINLFSE